jgi:chromosome segregation ATPase
MSKRIKELREEVRYLKDVIGTKERRIKELEKQLDFMSNAQMTNSKLEDADRSIMYLRGQIEVLKRVSGLYNEEILTHEEFMERNPLANQPF